MDSLDKDADACLRFLIANQDKWEPNFYMAHIHKEHPMTLIPVEKSPDALP